MNLPAETVGFVGLGAMGSRMASRLLDAGHPLCVHDARPDVADALAGRGARVAATPREVADAAATVLVSLPTPDVVREVALGSGGLLGGRALRRYVDLSTTGPVVAQEVAGRLSAAGVACVDAPVSGGPAGAAGGRLTVMVSGPGAAVEAVRPLLGALGSSVLVVGERPGQGQVAKLVNNLLSASAIAITAEAVALGVKSGLDPGTLLDVLACSSGSNTAVQDKFPRQVLTRRFDHGFRLALMTKDVRLCLDEARRRDVPMLLGSAVEQLWGLALGQLGDEADCTAMAQIVERWAGTTIAREGA
jgi:3-hydroxyisobutyrate dehydrogenase-like beta-hydroxyacid dehydrogenase